MRNLSVLLPIFAVNAFAGLDGIWESFDCFHNVCGDGYLSLNYQFENEKVIKYWQWHRVLNPDPNSRERLDERICLGEGSFIIKEQRIEGEYEIYEVIEEIDRDSGVYSHHEVIYINGEKGTMGFRNPDGKIVENYCRICSEKSQNTETGQKQQDETKAL